MVEEFSRLQGHLPLRSLGCALKAMRLGHRVNSLSTLLLPLISTYAVSESG